MSASSKLRVFLADDHPVVLAGIKSLLVADPGIEVVGEAGDGPAALAMAKELNPDVLVLDLSMPGLNGVEVARDMRAASPQCKVLVLTVHEDRSYVRKLLEVGVAGYVLKRSAAADLPHAVHAVAAGGTYLDPAIAGQLVDSVVNPSRVDATENAVDLSEREVDVLRLTALGHSNKAIANLLKLGVKSVETYKARAMDKLGFHGRVELVGYALRRGWLTAAPDVDV
ncbi:DNA-binding response regulator [Rhodoblastus sphagnicola]|uniref:DNA-binding response regulator n=1 Tax=Rhodoblastus sphagnicola TaxID=333368 RepID=A0A2S6NH33_9HYPH|nr:response regulator transcription factor [Rhodoblastus sphagnicola]MBB4200312.1 DNA-binding NarL/FixJ family response regulator [Rhodoblastus sphagnicola]PPQ33926.1 DNA-binding response regulator [Rhodoblastus sphagnicola]